MIALDLSRLLSRAGRATPTGIDRVELAYAKHLLAGYAANSCFVAATASGGLGLLHQRVARQFVSEIAIAWRGDANPARQDRVVRQIARQARIALLAGRER